MRALALWLLLAGCGAQHSTTIVCGSGTQGTLTTAAPVAVSASNGQDLRGAAIAADAHTTLPANDVSIACAADIAPPGFVALGPAVSFGSEGTWSDRPFELTLPYKAARLPKDGNRSHVRVVAKRANGGTAFFPPVSNRKLDDGDAYASRVTFRGGELTTYQVVAAETAGQPTMQQYGWSAIVGVSMGGNAAMSIAMRHPDRFDAFADLGGEPGPSMIYTLSMIRRFLWGGFCSAADQAAGGGSIGQMCPNKTLKPEQFEQASDFEHMLYQSGDGVGLTLDRSFYMKGTRDMARAFSNPALYNGTHPYAPPGVDPSFLALDAATRCASPTVLRDFHDRDFNPDGGKPVITFCDGGDSTALGLGVFDPSIPQQDPAEIALVVDLNGNGKRDPGEPVIAQPYEPFSDVGSDGLADKDEPGYDPITNPDPSGDNYHYLRNPLGTEGNGTWDQGEPFEDVGLDGVAGTCQQGQTPPTGVAGCYDHGEGNGKWDLAPNVASWYANDFPLLLAALTDDQRAHMAMWFDAGIRDFLNNSVSSNRAVGDAAARFQAPFGVYDDFDVLTGDTNDNAYDYTTVPWNDLPKHGYMRYGDPDAPDGLIQMGDGRHVGTANQIIYRVETAFGWLDHRWPDGDRTDADDGGQILNTQTFTSPNTGRVSPFSLYLPPGYNNPANANARYPVVYVLHGYGQQPMDLVALSAVIANHMISSEPLATRTQKFIMVYVDGRCRPGHEGVPVPPGGDGCEQGTFFMNTPLGGPAQMEQNMLDLMDYIDANYRTRAPSAAAGID